MSSTSGESPIQHHHQHRVSHLVKSVFAYDSNVMLAALISLLLVILFVLLLHVYAKWFLSQAQTQAHRRRRTTSAAVSRVLNNLPPSSTFVLDLASLSTSTASKGLEPSIISKIPLFVHDGDGKSGLECVICLSAFDRGDVGRYLPKCGHEFHLECIDMWLGSHSNCPICRAPVVSDTVAGDGTTTDTDVGDCDSVAVVEVPSAGHDHGESSVGNDSSSSPSSSSPSSSSFGCSLKRMLSRTRSENKVFPATSVSELAIA